MKRWNLRTSRAGLSSLLTLLLFIGLSPGMKAQTTLSTTSSMTNGNGSGTVTFNLQNTNPYDVIITNIGGVTGTSGSVGVELWYKPTALTAAPGAISVANGWTQAATATITGVANSTTTVTQPFLSNISFTIPAGATYGIAVYALGQRYSGTASAPQAALTLSAGGLNFITGPVIGYGGGTPPAAPSNAARGWIGTITFIAATPCVSPPTGGSATVSNASPCFGTTVDLGLTGNSGGMGQSYQWEESASSTGPWAPVTGATNQNVTVTVNGSKYYHAVLTCGGISATSAPVQVTVPTPFPGGVYTVDGSMPTDILSGGTNFNTFSDFASAVGCGIGGPITVNVAPGTYTQRIFLNSIGGTSASSPIIINGNGATLNYTSTNTNERGVITLNGTDFVTINNFNINAYSTSTTNYGWGVFMTNDANNNTVNGCTITLDSNTSSTNYAGIVVSGSATVATTVGSNCDNITLTNNTVIGGYYGITLLGNTGTAVSANCNISNNIVRNFYLYGIYAGGTDNALIEANDVHRLDRTTLTTFGGIYFVTYNANLKVRRNRIHDPATAVPANTSTYYGIYLSASMPPAGSENEISNNIVYNFNGAGAQYAFYNSTSGNTRYYYNSLSSQSSVSSTSTTYGFYQTGATSGLDLKNNNFAITRNATGNKVGIYMATTTTTFSSNYNNIYVAGTGTTNYVGSWGTTMQASLANWQTASGSQDMNSQVMNPNYANAAGGDLTPANGVLNNLGLANSVVTTDILGNPRDPSTPDIGAYEFSVPPCFGNPVAGTASVSAASVCAGSNVTLNLIGTSVASGLNIEWMSSPAGAFSWTSIGTGPSLTTAMPASATDFQAVVTCMNGGGVDMSNVVSVGVNPFYQCYCSPLTGTTLHSSTGNYITAVSITGTPLSVTTTAIGPGAYTQHNPATPTNTATLTQAQTYTLNASIASASYGTELWIDWDQNGSFDAAEYQVLSFATAATASIYVPVTAVTGMTGMRLRNCASTTTLFGASGSCSNISIGRETEDFVITIAPAVQCAGIPSATGTATAAPLAVCYGNPINLNATGYTTDQNISINWEWSPAGQGIWQPIANATTAAFTYTGATGATDFRLAVTCNNAGGGTGYSNAVTVSVNNPQMLSTSGASVCGQGSVILNATPDIGASVNWYANATGGATLATGNAFSTPVLTSTTTYYAAASSGGSTATLGLPNRVGATTNSGYSDVGLMFDATTAFNLQSVAVYPVGTGGTVVTTIQLKNSAGTVLATTTVNLTTSASPGVKTVVPLNFQVPAGTGHRLVFNGATGGGITGFIRELTTGFTYPYTVSGVASITSAYTGGASASYYYYFYDWQISSGCEGARVPVVATVNAATPIAATASPDSICLGSSSTLHVSSANSNYAYTWTPGGVTGATTAVSPTTTTTYTVTAFDATTNCTATQAVEVAVKATAATVATVANHLDFCVSGALSLTLNPAPTAGITYQWQKDAGSGFVNISGAVSSSYAETVTQSATYRANMYCNGTLVNTSVPAVISVNNPQLLGTQGATVCGTGSAALTATPGAGASINWYAASTGGSTLATGNTFTTPVLTSTTTYYAAASSGGSNGAMGLPNRVGATTNSGYTDVGLMFDATTAFTLQSVAVYPVGTGGTVATTIQLKNSAGTVLATTTVNLTTSTSPGIKTVVPLNFTVPVGTGHRLVFNGATGGGITGFIREATTGYTYPYTFPGVASITSAYTGGASSAYYYYFYDWQISTGCETPRVPVVATVNVGTPITATASVDTICAGSSSTLTATSANSNFVYTWTPGGATGNTVTVSPAQTTVYTVSGYDAAANCTTTDDVTVTVKSTAATVATVASGTDFCVSGALSLSINPTPLFGIDYQWQVDNGTGFANIAGATNSTYSTTVTTSAAYRMNMYCGGNMVNTSTAQSITVNNPSILSTVPGNACNGGTAVLGATASTGASVKWYAAATGGNPLFTGNSFITPAITSTTTYYAAAATGTGGYGASPIQITEIDLGTNDRVEIQNVSGGAVDVTGWKVAISNSYTAFNSVNANIQTLSGPMSAGATMSWTDLAAGPNYWGSNILFNPGAYPTYTGWVAVIDATGNLMDIVVMNWPSATIQTTPITIGTATVNPGTKWTGDGINTTTVAATDGVSRQGTLDNNAATDFSIIPLSMGTTNPGMTLPFQGFGCEGTRVPVVATVGGSVTPAVSIAASANNVCAGTSITFTATPTYGGTAPAYQWMVNGGNVAGATAATYTSSTLSNNDVVSVQMTSSESCASPTTATSNSVTMTITPPANTVTNASNCVSYTWAVNGQQYTQSGTYTVTSPCAVQTLNLVIKQPTSSSVTVSASGSYTWNGQTYTASGNYNWVGTNAAGCDSTVTLHLTIVPGCIPTSSTQSAAACGSYTWHGVTYTASTNTATWVTTNAAGCDSTITLNLVITPNTSNTTTASACGSYTWSVNGQTYTQSGTYNVVTGCHTEILALTILQAAPSSITPDGATTICAAGGSVTLTAGAGASYQWNTGDFTQSILVTSAATYSVTVTSANGCTSQASIVISSKAMPATAKIKVVGSATVCAPNEVAYILDMPLGSTTGFAYQWKLNGTPVAGANDSVFSADATGAYTVTISGGSSCTKTSAAKNATVKPLPTADFTTGGATSFCSGGSVTLTAASAGTGATYTWLKNGSTNAGSGATKSFTVSGDYSLVVTLGGCKDTSNYSELVTVHPAAPNSKVMVVGGATVCAPAMVNLSLDATVASMGSSFQWNLDGMPIAGANDSTYAADTSGMYSLTLTTANGCTKTSSAKKATVKPLPVADFTVGGPTEFCTGGQVVFTAPSLSGYTYTWLKDGVNAGSGTSKAFKFAGVYTVVATLAGCKDTADYTESVIVNPLPVAAVSTMDPTTFCAGGYATIVATPSGAGNTYAWYKTNVLDAGNTSDNYMATLAGTYKVVVTDDNGCVSKMSTTSVVIKVNPIPVASITAQGSTTIAANGNVKLKATPASGVTWQWYLDGVAISGATGKEHIATVGGDYTVEVTKLGCTGVSPATTVTQNSVKEEVGTTSNPAGTEEASTIFELSAFPNPVSNILNVNVRGIEEVDATLQVMDMNGKLVTEKDMHDASATIDMTGYANGMYLIRYKDNQGRTGTIKVNKQ